MAILMMAGCFGDEYECAHDSDCNLGEAGRCEVDHHCTAYDPVCPIGRRYTAYSGSESGVCWDGRAALVDPCAGGQPPAARDPCSDAVCAALPACCDTGWSDACVVEAQLRCTITCDTRIAITATNSSGVALWDLRHSGQQWTATSRVHDRMTFLAYLPPAHAATEPRLAGFVQPGVFAVGDGASEVDYAVDATHRYDGAASVDFDRDLRDTVVLSSLDSATPATPLAEVIKLDDGSIRSVTTMASAHETWGDDDHDAFPDAVAGIGKRYLFLDNVDDGTHARAIDSSVSSAFGGPATASPTLRSPQVRSFEWADLDGDRILDLVGFGSSLEVHFGQLRLSDRASVSIDCDPPSASACPAGSGSAAAAAYSGTILPGDSIIAATWPRRGVYRIHIAGSPPVAAITPIAIVDYPVAHVADSAPMVAVIARDLDGDHLLDLVAIDGRLHLFTALTRSDPGLTTLVETARLTSSGEYTDVRVSVSGALR